MLEQRYEVVKAYQQEMLEESANQRLARLGRAHRTDHHSLLAAIRHAIARVNVGDLGRPHGMRPPTAHPAH
ncbi:MAG TPA: hypothetical protein VK194_00685 [Candidatus Deferrimicrobium sp.]|nr:hypothetical protein [Candidatus Deferrimicrobium sp.]